MRQSQHEQNIIKAMKSFQRFGLYDVFADFVEWGTLSIRQAIDLRNQEEILKSMDRLQKKYTPQETQRMGEMFAMLVLAMDEYLRNGYYTDILSRIFMELEIQNKGTGQFFTPESVSRMVAKMTFDREKLERSIEEEGYFILNEPAVGGGIMPLCFAEEMRAAGFNPSKQLIVYAADIDMRCACMSYLHFSLYGLPAVIDYGNTLTLQYWQRWYSPVYVLDLWTFRDRIQIERRRRARDGTVDGTADRGRTDADEVRAGNPPQKEKAAGSGAFDEVQQLSLFDMS